MRRKISQIDSINYRNRMLAAEKKLRDQKNRWSSDWQNSWINIESLTLSDASFAKIDTARKLGHAVIILPGNRNEILIYADPL